MVSEGVEQGDVDILRKPGVGYIGRDQDNDVGAWRDGMRPFHIETLLHGRVVAGGRNRILDDTEVQ